MQVSKKNAVLYGIGFLPVSYTHLDVYKRQGRFTSCIFSALGFGMVEAVAGRSWGRVAPVSYTHLDVYKRQTLFNDDIITKEHNIADIAGTQNNINNCFLIVLISDLSFIPNLRKVR